jgi:hypothetical protein
MMNQHREVRANVQHSTLNAQRSSERIVSSAFLLKVERWKLNVERLPIVLLLSFCILQFAFCTCLAAPPTTDPSMDSILGLSQKAPTTQADVATQPAAAPTLKSENGPDLGRAGVIELSDGTKIKGHITSTPEKPIRVWVESEKQYEDVPIDQVDSVEVKVLWERDEKEWNFKESGSDIKVYSGRTYPARQVQYKFSLTDGTTVEGDVVAPLIVSTADGKSKTYVLYKRDKGDIGQTLKDRPYVKTVTFGK